MLADIAQRLLSVPDDALEHRWPWRSGEEGTEGAETELRYGFYRAYETLEQASYEVQDALRTAGVAPSRAVAPLAAATAARWDLHGLLMPLEDADLDRAPGGNEWTIRQTLGHIGASQRAYGWYTGWWWSRRGEPGPLPASPPDLDEIGFPGEDAEAAGSLAEIRERLDRNLELTAGRFANLDDDGLAAPGRWSGYPVTVAFRLGRCASHLREHTVQVEKTLVMLKRDPREVERLLRLVVAAWGRLEATVFALPPEALDTSARDGRSGAAIIDAAIGDVGDVARQLPVAAAAAVPLTPEWMLAEES